MIPPKPPSRPDKVSLWRYAKLFRQDILSAQPARLYRAWMAEFRTPFFRSYLVNQPELVKTILNERPVDFPKSSRIREGLAPLLGNSVFVTNGEEWERQRRIIDPAFGAGRIKETVPAIWEATASAVQRLSDQHTGDDPVEIEEHASHAAADVIFRTLFSIPIEHAVATDVFQAFRAYQRTQPLMNIGALLPLPSWIPRGHKLETRNSAQKIRSLITGITAARMDEIENGTAPDDLATKIMTTQDPETGARFDTQEMVDQVAIFFLAGHETSASALAWSLYLLATHPEAQDRILEEARVAIPDTGAPSFSDLSKLAFTRDVFREALRLYPPVPMMVRQNTKTEKFRDRVIKKGAQIVLSPWHLHRQNRLWDNPDGFDPGRWHTENGKTCQRSAYIPFSSGPRVCPGAGFAMVEGVLLIAALVKAFQFEPIADRVPEPVAHLTVRAKNGIWMKVTPR
jgi:cytochrome P450